LQNIVENQNLDELKDPKLIQTVVQNAIKNGNPDILKQSPDQLKQLAFKDILTSNVFYKQEDGGTIYSLIMTEQLLIIKKMKMIVINQ